MDDSIARRAAVGIANNKSNMAPRRAMAWLLLGLLCTAALAADQDVEGEAEDEDYEEEVPDRGFLVVRKKVVETDVVQGKDFTIQLSLHNAGNRYILQSVVAC